MSFRLPPLLLLSTLLALTALALVVHKFLRHRIKRRLRRMAGDWKMRYVERDLFHLAPRIATIIPVPGAADLRVIDVIYGSEGETHRYLFTAEYTRGVVGRHEREQRVMTFAEPKEPTRENPPTPLVCAPQDVPIVEQYRHLHAKAFRS
jgi:hypothetical protein